GFRPGSHMRFSIVLAVGAALAALALLASGCGETVIDPDKAEDAVQRDLEKALHAKITSVSCPSDQKVETGKTFSCTIEFADGERAEETLKITGNSDSPVLKPTDFQLLGGKNQKAPDEGRNSER